MRGPKVQSHASDRGEISEPAAAFVAWDGRASHVGPAAGNIVQRADGGKSRGVGGQRVARSVRGNGGGGNRSLEPRSQRGVFRGTFPGGGGCDPQQSGNSGR